MELLKTKLQTVYNEVTKEKSNGSMVTEMAAPQGGTQSPGVPFRTGGAGS